MAILSVNKADELHHVDDDISKQIKSYNPSGDAYLFFIESIYFF